MAGTRALWFHFDIATLPPSVSTATLLDISTNVTKVDLFSAM